MRAKKIVFAISCLMVGSVVAADHFESVFDWGRVSNDEEARAYAEIGVTDVFAVGVEGYAAAKRHGLRAYCGFWPCGRNSQVLTPEERKYFDYIKGADLPKQNTGGEDRNKILRERLATAKCQFGGEPVSSPDLCPELIRCFLSDTNCVMSFEALDKTLRENPEADGIAFDYIGYTNLRSCECDGCKARLKAWLKERGLEENEANRNKFFREGLVNYINALVDHARSVRPGIKVALHLYPAFLPDPLYGKELKADYIHETVAWYFAWPEEKIADYTRKILGSRHHSGSVSVPFVGFNAEANSSLPLKTPERLESELKLILANGGNRLSVCNGGDMLKPGYREIFVKYTKVVKRCDAHESAKTAAGVPEGCDPGVMGEDYWRLWNESEQARIDADIEANRKVDGAFAVPAEAGTIVKVEQIDHDFKFGAHIFNFNQLGRKEYNDAYKSSYGPGGIFNSATIAFYWSDYEPIPGKTRASGSYEDTEEYWNSLAPEAAATHPFWRRPAPGPVVEFCKERGLRLHGHVLVWGSAKPSWIWEWYCPEGEKSRFGAWGLQGFDALVWHQHNGSYGAYKTHWIRTWQRIFDDLSEEEVAARAPVFTQSMRDVFRNRVKGVAERFGDVVDSWDVVNESSADWAQYRKSRTGKPMWRSGYGLMSGDYPLHALLDAKEFIPGHAKLNVNDYNITEDFIAQVVDLEKEGAKIDIVGCQMHIFNTNDCMRLAQGATDVNWVGSPRAISDRLDMMAGKPIHVSEVTITSPGADARSRQIQAILARNIYRAWFAHKSLMGITWWNTVDGCGAKGEPLVSGLFTRDMQKKPAYLALDELINREWKTKLEVKVVFVVRETKGRKLEEIA